jgi:hypothetical protein
MRQTSPDIDIHPRRLGPVAVPAERTWAPGERATLLGRRPDGDDSSTYAPLATWAIVSSLALAATALGGQPVPALVAGGGLLLAAVFVAFERLSLLLTAAALVPAAYGGAVPVAAWVVAGALVAIAVGRNRAPVVVSMNELERHLTWCRRRNEPADVLTARIEDGDVREPAGLVQAFRITDSVELRRRAGGYDLTAVLDHHELDRAGLERRIGALCAAPVAWGWALFPRDGVTLDVLVERARNAARAERAFAPAAYRTEPLPATRSVA